MCVCTVLSQAFERYKTKIRADIAVVRNMHYINPDLNEYPLDEVSFERLRLVKGKEKFRIRINYKVEIDAKGYKENLRKGLNHSSDVEADAVPVSYILNKGCIQRSNTASHVMAMLCTYLINCII